MDLNFSQDSFAFSDIAPPSHVSGLESFSDFDISECSEASFAEIAANKSVDGNNETGLNGEDGVQVDGSLESSHNERSSLGLQGLNSNNINEFFEAIQNAESLGIVASSESGRSLAGDDSSLGILQLDGLPDFGDNLQSPPLVEEPLPLERTLVGDEEDEEDEIVINHHDTGSILHGEDIPFSSELGRTPVNRKTVLQLEEERPDTGLDPDTFFSSHNREVNNDASETVNGESLQYSYGREELDMMLQRRSGSGDGGELIDRVSLTSSISFIQSQSFPDSIFSQSFGSSRGLGSGMDSRSESDGHEDNDENAMPLLHGAGDGSNGSAGRPGLEGGNSDVEDLPTPAGLPLDASSRLETQGIGLRQSAEGVDVLPDILGDGGGGGDGSSGNNSDADDGGPAGAAYASSSASALPSSTYPPTITSFGFINPSTGGDALGSSAVPVTEGLAAGRGCPVGDSAADRSPVLVPSPPQQLNDPRDSISMSHPLHFQASSTPMVREAGQQGYNDTVVHNETSALESCYLMGRNPSTPYPAWADDSAFHTSQMLANRPASTLAEAESLTFDPPAGDTTATDHQDIHSPDLDMTLIPNEMAVGTTHAQPSRQRSGSWHVEQSALSAPSSNHSSDFSLKFSNSAFMDGNSTIDSSQLWKSTPRDEEAAAMRSTPGVVFQGHQRPSTVMGKVVENNQQDSGRLEQSSDGDQSTMLGSGLQTWKADSQVLTELRSGQNVADLSLDKTMTPGGVAEEFTMQAASPWAVNRSSSFPWPVGADDMQDSVLGQNPFDTEDSGDQQPWMFAGNAAVFKENPFSGESNNSVSWMTPDFAFEAQGDAAAIIAADEESFNREHELEIPSRVQSNDTTKPHDWTIPDSQFVTRPSLLKVVGVNDPSDIGEVRISFGAFLAAGSGELGSLSRTSPDRPRPHFGDDKPILTPSPQAPVRMISNPATPLDPVMQENSLDGFLNRTSADGGIKNVMQQQSKSSDDVAQRWQTQEQSTRIEQSGQSRSIDASSTHAPGTVPGDVLSFEMEKLKLDEQFKTDASVKSRSRTASQTSSQSSSSKGSVKSVIKKTDSQSAQSSRNVNGGKGSKPRERKHSHRQEKKERQNTTRKPLDVSSGLELKTDHELEGLYMHPSRMSFLSRSSLGDATSAERMTQFIAKAINEDPEELRKKLAAVEKQKVKVKLKKKQLPSSEVKTTSPNARTSHFNPLASSSPQTKSSPEKIVYSPRRFQGIEQNNSQISPEKLPSYTMEDSVFASQDSPSMVPLSLKELDSKDFPLERESMPSSKTGIFKHVIPQFGETYTVHKAEKEADQQQQTVPIIDPRKNRTHEIEQRLNRSLPQSIDPYVSYDGNFPHSPMSTGQFHTLSQEMNTMQSDSSPRTQRLDASDSAVGSMTTVQSQDMTNSRHSWPEATPSNQHKQREFHRADHARDNKSQPSSPATTVEGPMGHSALTGDLKVAVQTGNLMHEQQTSHLVNQHYPPVGLPLSIAQGIVPLGNPGTVSPLYPPDGSSGLPGMIGPILTGHGLNVQTHGTLSYTAPTAYGSRMVPLGSAMYPAQGHGTMNTFYGHVPFVQTVSASMGPKPSSLTPTYVQSLNVNIPHNNPGQQAPLHLQANGSSMPGFPTSFTQPRAPESMPFHQHPSQQVRNGLLQVRPDFSPEVALPTPTQVIIPGEIKLPPFCCVGVLTETVIPLHNSSGRWIHCEIHSMLCTVNGVQVPSSASVFSHQPKVIIAPHTAENVKISFEPNEAGTFTAQLQVYSVPVVCDVQPMTHSLGPVLALNVVAEEPKVEVVLEDDNTIHFGEVSCGAKQCRPIHLINRGRAQVPIRIILSANSSSLHCFAFADTDFSPKTDVLRGAAPAGAKGSTLTIHTLSLKGRKDLTSIVEPTVVWLLFQSQKIGLNSTSSAGPPEEYTARLDVEIDSARQGPTISSVALKALEGIVRLHTPHKLQVLTLKSSLGKIASCTIPVKNAGNITAKVKLKIEGDSKQFSVKPIQLHLKPNEESEVQVMFQPTEANKQVESLVVLTVPNGPVYELVVKGSASPKDDDKFSLFSSKQVLCWSGVALGRSQQQKVILKTSSTSPVKLQLLIEGSHSDFQIQPMFSSHGGSPEHPQATLQPKKALPVHVSFSPSSMGLISSSLVIKSLTGNTKSMIPLYGCGGTSQLVLVDIRQLSEGYVINVGEVSLGKKNSVKVMVRNSGTRAAFVKAVCYSDIHALKQYPSSHLRVHPDTFVLSERTSKAVFIEYQPLEKDAINCRTSVNSVAVLAFYTGDEFLRRQYKKYLQKGPWEPPSESMERSLLAGIDFTSTFQDEDKLVEDVKYPKVASWDSFFQSSVSRVLLTLVGSPPGPSDPNRSVDIVPVSDKGNPEAESWTVIPDFLTLAPCNSKDEKSGKGSEQLQIVNFSDRSIGFEFTWPAHSIVITPERGQIPPRSQGRVLVSAKPNLSGSVTQLPWAGTIYLKCDGRQQSIRVQIREEQVLESSPYQSSVLSFSSIPTTVGGSTPLPTNHLPPLRIKNNDIVFEKTLIGTVTTSEISLTNTASAELTWNLSSVAPAYVKVDDSGNICRTTYLAFNVAKRGGTIEAGKTMQIVVKFQPRDVGEYEQSWDLMTISSSSKSKQKIFLHGQAVDRIGEFEQKAEDANLFQPSKSKKVTIKEPLRLSKSQKKGLYVTENVLNFPVTAPGATSVAKLQISNYSLGESPYSVRISPPIKPFSVQSRKFSVRPHRYVRFPVSFSPTEAGKSFEASLVITADPDIILTVQLQGSSAE